MSQAEPARVSSVVAVYPDHAAAENALRQLHEGGFALDDLSIVGRDLQVTEEPSRLVSRGECARAGAKTGASFGGVLGLILGAGILILPGVGPVVAAGPIAAALLAGLEGVVAGTALGGLAGALVGWDVPPDRALHYETQVKGGKFIVVLRSIPEVVARARSLLAPQGAEHIEVYEPPR